MIGVVWFDVAALSAFKKAVAAYERLPVVRSGA
jgi:hypothetical protein